MRQFCNRKWFVLFIWTIGGPLLFADHLVVSVLGQPHPGAAFGPPGVIGLPSSAASPQQPCDRTRRVFTETYGEISDGPAGYNYTQVRAV